MRWRKSGEPIETTSEVALAPDYAEPLCAWRLWEVEDGGKVTVGGVVTHRQRPATAEGITFVNLEDETGLVNVICSKGVWARYRRVARSAPALLVGGRLEKVDGVLNVVAERIEQLSLSMATTRSRDFR